MFSIVSELLNTFNRDIDEAKLKQFKQVKEFAEFTELKAFTEWQEFKQFKTRIVTLTAYSVKYNIVT